MIPYILFFLAGFGWGFALYGIWRWTVLLFPLILAAGAFAKDGVSGEGALELLLALGVTAGGIVLGTVLATREDRAQPA